MERGRERERDRGRQERGEEERSQGNKNSAYYLIPQMSTITELDQAETRKEELNLG